MRRPAPVAAVLGAVLVAACSREGAAPDLAPDAVPVVVAEQPFAPLTGPHAVGARDLFFLLERPEPFTSDPEDRRRLLVRVWYPAEISATDELARYVPDPAEFDGADSFAGVLHVRTRAYRDARADGSQAPYPVLVFHPGGGWTRLSDTFWTEQLASHGYVVFAVDHQGFNQSVVFPDGHRFTPDQLGFPEESGDLESDARAFWAQLDQHHFPLWLEDHAALLDRIEMMAADTADDLAPLLDTSRIGLFGWSFGGALAVQASRDDPRVLAAIDGDGQLFGDVQRTGTPKPLLLLHSEPEPVPAEQRAVLEELMAEVEAGFASLRANSPRVWDVTLRGASHGSFSDLVLAATPPADRLSAARGHQIINTLSLAFFDRHLKEGSTNLSDVIASIPEAIEVSRPEDE